jgi:hypothetical protein
MKSPAGRLIEDRLARLTEDLDTLFAESRECARREFAEQLNQAVRRLRIADDLEPLCDTLESAAAQFADGALLFRIEGGSACHERIEIALDSAAAFKGAVESGEPQTAVTSPAEVSAALVAMFDHDATGRANVYPVHDGESVVALVYTWGAKQGAALELLAQVAGAVWSAAARASEPPPQLVTIAAAPAPKSPWESLSPEEQQIHLRAQRFARVQAAEMRLYEPDAVQTGRARRDLYGALRKPIDAARKSFREQFFPNCPSMVDYLHLELVRTLANDDPDLFGNQYPGPLV